MDPHRFDELMDAYLDGEESVELESALRESAEFRRLFVERSMLHANLFQSFAHSKGAAIPRKVHRWPAVAWAAAIVAMLLGGWIVFRGHESRLEAGLHQLSDGSSIRLSRESSAMVSPRRAVLEKGKAVFIVKDGEKLFQIDTPAGPVTIRSGEVSVEIANEEESMNTLMVIVAVAAGSAEVRTPDKAVVMTPGMNRVYAAKQDEKKKGESEYTLHVKGKVTELTKETITVTRPATSKQDETSFTFRLSEVPIKNPPAKVGMACAVFYGQDGEAAYIQVYTPDEGNEAKKKPAQDKKKDPEPKKKPAADGEKKKDGAPAGNVIKGKITHADKGVIVVNGDIKIALQDVKTEGPAPQVGFVAVVYYGPEGQILRVLIHDPSGDGEKKPVEKKGDPAPEKKKQDGEGLLPSLKGKIVDVDKEKQTVTISDGENEHTLSLEGIKIDGALTLGSVAVVYSGPEGDPVLIRTDFSDKNAPEKKPDGGEKKAPSKSKD